MRKHSVPRPSASMAVALTALVISASGTAIAASRLVSGDKLIGQHSLSGNRLRNHTLTGTQIKLSKLGKVPSASHAYSATSATTATSAGTAASARTANTAAVASSVSGVQLVAAATETNSHGQTNSESATCPAGMSAIGGGVIDSGTTDQSINLEQIISVTGGTDNAFAAAVSDTSATIDETFHVFAVCMPGAVTGSS